MSDFDYQPAQEPTFYFIGVTTGKSSIMKVFPAWMRHLEQNVAIRGIDCKIHDDPEVYRRVVDFIKGDELSLGGLVTTHKLDLLEAARDRFDRLDRYAEMLGEISCISKRAGKLHGSAKDPITSGLSLEAFVPEGHWRESGGAVCLLGAGGSSLALSVYLMEQKSAEDRPSKIVVTNRSPKRLESMEQVHKEVNPGIPVEYHHCPEPEQNDQVVNALPPASLVANTTGLGKDAPGSPLTENARFPEGGYAWDFNYRGDLLFLEQAQAQAQERGLHVDDGWVYFIHGWRSVIADVLDIELPTEGPQFDELSRVAAEARRRNYKKAL
jgi:shikimate 5-dehydrogenase